MRPITRMAAVALAGVALAGCSEITVTSNTLVNGTARIADATTNAVNATSNVTTNTADDVDARTHAARRKFVDSQYAMIKREAAQGNGENLDTLAYMMHADNTQAFDHELQSHYQALFTSDSDADQWLTRLYQVVGTPPDMQTAKVASAS